MTTLHLRKSIGRPPLPRRSPATGGRRWACRAVVRRSRDEGGSLITVLVLALCCFAPCSVLQAVTPAPDGGYSGFNTAEGTDALYSLTSGTENTAIGYNALYYDTIGSNNTAIGLDALFRNTSGNFNTANGLQALYHNTTGSRNTAIGPDALFSNTTGNDNTAIGLQALLSNTTGASNTAFGYKALYSNTTGFNNTANGSFALYSNTTGFDNTANGVGALYSNTTGGDNTAFGYSALLSNTTGSGNIALGAFAGERLTTGSGNIDIGNLGVADDSDRIRIGVQGTQTRAFVAGIHGATVTGTAVVVNSSGQLGVAPSSRRFKKEIKPMDKASEAILALKPVTFRYKHELDSDGIAQFGLVAEEVEKVNPALVVRDAEGKVFTVRYEAVNAMLLNEFLKEHRKVEEQERKLSEQDRNVEEQETAITQLRSTVAKQEVVIAQQQNGFESKIAHQQMQIEALTAGLQRVSAQVEMSRPTPQMVLNNQ